MTSSDRENQINSYDSILEDLYNRYFMSFSGHSGVTSSHWRTVGRQKVSTENNKWRISGYGFGSFHAARLSNKIKFIPQKLLISHLLKKNHCSEYLVKQGKLAASLSGRLFDFDCVKQVLSLNLIIKLLGKDVYLSRQGIKTICVIGDGYGYFSSLLRLVDPDVRVISINLGRTLFFDVLYSMKCCPGVHPALLTEERDKNKLVSENELIFIEAENYSFLKGLPIDLFVNIASMQEMDIGVIERYFEYIRSSTRSPCYFYCCNRLEKTLPDGTVVKFMKYPWQDSIILLDELCPWYQKYPSSKPPFWFSFDGQIQHRFVKIKDNR